MSTESTLQEIYDVHHNSALFQVHLANQKNDIPSKLGVLWNGRELYLLSGKGESLPGILWQHIRNLWAQLLELFGLLSFDQAKIDELCKGFKDYFVAVYQPEAAQMESQLVPTEIQSESRQTEKQDQVKIDSPSTALTVLPLETTDDNTEKLLVVFEDFAPQLKTVIELAQKTMNLVSSLDPNRCSNPECPLNSLINFIDVPEKATQKTFLELTTGSS